MTQPFKIRISTDGQKKRSYNHGKGCENYNKVNDFVFSDDLRVWMNGKSIHTKNAKPLF